MSFALFPCPKFAPYYWRRILHFSLPKNCTLVTPFLNGAEFTLSVAKNVALFEPVPVLRFASVKWRVRRSKHRNKRSNFRPNCPSSHRKNESNLIPKTIGNRKRACARGCARRINTTWENLQIKKHKSVRWVDRTPSWFLLFDLQIFSGGVYPPSATSSTISFSISNSFWY